MRVSTADLLRNFGALGDTALNEPVIVTRNGRDRLALISIDEYNRFLEVSRNYRVIRSFLERLENEFAEEMKAALVDDDDYKVVRALPRSA